MTPARSTIPDVDAASHQFGMLAYGEIREKGLLGEPVTDDDIAAAVRRTVEVFLRGYATPRRREGAAP